MHLPVGRLSRADTDREFGSQVEHVGRRRPHHEAMHSLGHPHDEVPAVQVRRELPKQPPSRLTAVEDGSQPPLLDFTEIAVGKAAEQHPQLFTLGLRKVHLCRRLR